MPSQVDIHAEYANDMRAAGLTNLTVKRSWFAKVLRNTPELKDITISTLKRNFGRCSVRTSWLPLLQYLPTTYCASPPLISEQVVGSNILATTIPRQVCVELEARVARALKGHNASELAQVKEERVAHLGLSRSDKIHYYTQREKVRFRGVTRDRFNLLAFTAPLCLCSHGARPHRLIPHCPTAPGAL